MADQKSSHETERHVAIYGSDHGKSKRWELRGDENDPEFKKTLNIAVHHPPKERFVRNPLPNVVLGDWDDDIVKVELDDRYTQAQVKRIGHMLNSRYALDGFIILVSSEITRKIEDAKYTKVVYRFRQKNFHLVFNRKASYAELNRILAWLCLTLKDENLTRWFHLQMIKGTYTLRHGFKREKKPPRVVYCYGNQDKQIAKFLANREFVLGFLGECPR
jgi:hypothetical protein